MSCALRSTELSAAAAWRPRQPGAGPGRAVPAQRASPRGRVKFAATGWSAIAIVVASLVLSVGLIALLSGFFAGRDQAGVAGAQTGPVQRVTRTSVTAI